MLSELASPVLAGWSIFHGFYWASDLLRERPPLSLLPLPFTVPNSVCRGSSLMSRIRLRHRSWMISAVAWTSLYQCLHGITSPVLLRPPQLFYGTFSPLILFLCDVMDTCQL